MQNYNVSKFDKSELNDSNELSSASFDNSFQSCFIKHCFWFYVRRWFSGVSFDSVSGVLFDNTFWCFI